MDEDCIVLGLDGLDYQILQQAMDERELPHFEELAENGILTELTSCHPPTTVPGWACMLTGKNPGKIGMFHFQHPDWTNQEFVPADYASLFGTYCWDMEGIETAIAFVPGVSPPYTIEGRMIEGKPGLKNFRTAPKELKDEIITEDEQDVFDQSFDTKAEETKAVFETRTNVVHRLAEDHKQDLLITVYNPADYMAHGCDRYETLYDVYEYLDDELGYFMEHAEAEDATLLIASDHGTNKFDSVFFMTSWLHQNGYLPYTEERNPLHKSVLKLGYKLIDLGLGKPIKYLNSLIRSSTGTDLNPDNEPVSERFDWENADAVPYMIQSLPTIGIELNEAKLGEDLPDVRDQMVEELEKEDLIAWVKTREELYTGDKISQMPHIIVKGNKGVRMASTIHESTSMKLEAFGHGYGGVFGAYGDEIQPADIDAHLVDVAPTILHMLNKPIPEDMDGTPHTNMINTEREPKTSVPIQTDVETIENLDEEKVKDRLEALGYIGD